MKSQNSISSTFRFIKIEWSKRPLFYSVFIFSAVFIFSRLIILFIPYVEITYDSIEYINYIDNYIAKGVLPPVDYLPIGYPLFVRLLSYIHNSAFFIVLTQTFITGIACVFLIVATEKSYPLKSWLLVIPLSIFVLTPKNLLYDITLTTESLYVSSFFFVVAFIILALHSLQKRYWIGLSISLFIPILFRPNGVITIVLFFVILVFSIVNSKKKVLLLSFIVPYIILLLCISIYSVVASNSFTISSPSRMKNELNMRSGMSEGAQIEFGKECLCIEKPSFRKMIKQYYFFKGYHTFNPKLKNIYEKYHVFNWPVNLNMGPPNNSYEIDMNKFVSEREKRNAFKEFYDKSYIEKVECKAVKYRKTIFFKVYDWYQMNIHRHLFASLFWPIFFFICFFIGIIQFLRSKLTSKDYLIFILLCALNIGTNLIHVITTHRTLARYEYPGEFLYYLAPFFLLICFKNAKK